MMRGDVSDCALCTSPSDARERLKGIDGKGMISKCGWEMKKTMCVRFLFVQPGVVSRCSVTKRISFVNSFAAVSRKGVLEFVWIFIFEAPFQRYVGLSLLAFWTEFGASFSRELHACVFSTFTVLLILHISDERWLRKRCSGVSSRAYSDC